MLFVGNLLWFIFGGGLFACIGWCLLGALLCITIVGIPAGIAAFRIAGFAAWPFGRQLIDKTIIGQKRVPGTTVANVLWILLAGLWLALAHVLCGISYCLTIIFIPFGLAHFKLAAVCFAPLGKCPVPNAVAQAAIAAHAHRQVNPTK